MSFELVLLERVDENSITANSGILIDNKFILVTTNIFDPEKEAEKQWKNWKKFGNIYLSPLENNSVIINCVKKNDNGTYDIKSANVLAVYFSNLIHKSDIFFENFTVDALGNCIHSKDQLSTFYILRFGSKCNLEELKQSLKGWWGLLSSYNLKKYDNIYIESSPFGNRHFLNSVSRGIVSNIVGEQDCLILTDCPTTPGSEGSPVFIGEHK